VSPSSSPYTPPPAPPEHRSGLTTALVAGALIALLAANIYLYVQIDHVRADLTKTQDKISTDIANLRDSSSVTVAAQQRHLEALKEELASAREQARTMSSQAKVEAQAHADVLAKQIQAEEAQMNRKVTSQISDVQQQTTAANAKIADVSTDVGTVKTQVTQTQSELDKTIADLKSVRGDLGVQSGLVATNGTELEALKRLGQRNYIDIKLGKTKQPVRFGDITLKLDASDAKRNKYSIYVMADDKQTLKKDKSINEPVQFYTAKGGHIPYEIVINTVSKNEIVGYLSTPKETATR
jgi:DNA repair exonuclease SbcCD ATPase subunit